MCLRGRAALCARAIWKRWMRLGIALTLSARAREAIAVFDDALKLAPDALHLILHRAHPLEDAGRCAKRRRAGTGAGAAARNLRALDRLANLVGAARRHGGGARLHATRALAIAPLASATIALATAEIAEGNFDARAATAAAHCRRCCRPIRSIAPSRKA